MNLVLCKYKITGLFPLLTHSPAGMRQAANAPKVKKIPSPEDEAQAGLYIDNDGNYCIPSIAFRSALLNGLKGKKIGKVGAISVFQAAVFNVDELSPLVDPETGRALREYTIDTRRAIVQRQGILRNRPRFEKWGCNVFLQIDLEITTPEQVEEALNTAGQIIGVGDFRIEKRGMFGKFQAELVE
jgi:hypothetical protein